MPNISVLKSSKFLTKEDVTPPVLGTIESVHQMNVAKEGAPEELKWVVVFEESEKPMVLNSTNGQLIAQITGSDETDNWPGHKVVLYNDPAVSFGGKITGGIRVRAPKGQGKPAQPQGERKPDPAPAKPAMPAAPDDQDVPF